MRVVPYMIDLDENYDTFVNFLKERNPKTAESTEEHMQTH